MCSRIEKKKKLVNKREDIEQGEPVYNASKSKLELIYNYAEFLVIEA